RANAGLDRIPDSVMIILGKVRPLSGRLLGPHPQVLIIALQDPRLKYLRRKDAGKHARPREIDLILSRLPE
ncbi:hypothetical protein, partial [Mycolicibacterium mucogenicum]|uniref:hypothetical protein n=1 Tax=Mycolicibacterium mucogenicum TaxID=56689 RepID=UPI001A962C4B